MPIALTLTEGVIPQQNHETAVAKIAAAFLEHHGLGGNKVMTPNVNDAPFDFAKGRHLLRRQTC